jgi:hypothetical protein
VLGDSNDEVGRLAELIGDRAARIDPEEAARTREDLKDFVDDWAARNALREYSWYGKRNREALTIRAEKAAEMRAQRREVGDMWVIPSTMRNVEPGTPVKLVRPLRAAQTEDRE